MKEQPLKSMETLPAQGATAIGPAIGTTPAVNPIRFTVDRADGVYALGKTARVVIAWDANAGPTPAGGFGRVSLARDLHVPFGERAWPLDQGPLTLELTLDEPGQILVTVTIGRNGAPAPLHQKSMGILFGPEAMAPSAREPADFDAFWAGELRAWRAALLSPVLTGVPSGNPGVEAWDVQIPIAQERPVFGYLARPKAARPGTCPAVLLLHSASGYMSADLPLATEFAGRGFLALDVTPHGLPNAQPDAFYMAQQAAGNFRTYGLGSRDTWYFKGMFLRVAMALDTLAGRPEWNGRFLGIFGSSMGGAQALAGAALDPRVTALALNVPAMCDLNPTPPRLGAWPRPVADETIQTFGLETIVATVAYFDMVFFARRIKATVLTTIGLSDATCPAQGQQTMVNQLRGPVTARVYPELVHGWVPQGREQLHDFLEQQAHGGHISGVL
jgi:cephalosporin-C deacetylase-like acetyl esterase